MGKTNQEILDELDKRKGGILMIEIAKAEFMLGEKPYTVRALGLADSEVWRQKFQDEAVKLLSLLKQQEDVFDGLNDFKDLLKQDLFSLLPVLAEAFVRVNGSMNVLVELVTGYGEALAKDAEYIRKEATMGQALAALMEMVKLEYPFGVIFQKKPGPAAVTT